MIIMQKVFNVFSTISFVGVLAIGGAAGYVYLNQEALTEKAKEQITTMITDAVGGAVGDLPNLMGGGGGGLPVPSSPAGTGLPVPF